MARARLKGSWCMSAAGEAPDGGLPPIRGDSGDSYSSSTAASVMAAAASGCLGLSAAGRASGGGSPYAGKSGVDSTAVTRNSSPSEDAVTTGATAPTTLRESAWSLFHSPLFPPGPPCTIGFAASPGEHVSRCSAGSWATGTPPRWSLSSCSETRPPVSLLSEAFRSADSSFSTKQPQCDAAEEGGAEARACGTSEGGGGEGHSSAEAGQPLGLPCTRDVPGAASQPGGAGPCSRSDRDAPRRDCDEGGESSAVSLLTGAGIQIGDRSQPIDIVHGSAEECQAHHKRQLALLLLAHRREQMAPALV
ncbi:hypothetical protein FOA52_000180 [Chlamydomonas sp. UWO 241]|nr:hypothetical protein FOA52_000180 [Chlamydomonas sp. UWO 241]